jgi:hypothetical protein
MSQSIYFSIKIKTTDKDDQRGMVVHIPHDPARLPGERIKGLTEAARTFATTVGGKLRTEMLVAPPADLDLRPVSDYLWGDGSLNPDRLVRHLADYFAGRKPHRFQPKVGMTVIMEEEFIGRKPTLAKLEEHLASRQSCHLRAPRRYGKSSLMGRLVAKLENAIMLELSDVGTLPGFLKMLLRSCMRHEIARPVLHQLAAFKSWAQEASHDNFSQLFNAEFAELIRNISFAKLKELIKETMTALADAQIILLVDEFSLFLRDMHERDPSELTIFLNIYHDLRTRHEHPLITVFAGSAGLSTYIELYGMHEQFDDLIQVDVLPVRSVEARLLAEELFYGMEKLPAPEVLGRLVALTGNDDTVPYFVQALASYTAEQAGQRQEISTSDVELAYYDRLLGPQGNVCFRDFILRERAYPDDYRKCASPILKKLSQSQVVISEDELLQLCKAGCDFNKLMTCLEEDYDLVHEAAGWRMRSRVIADRWRLGEPWLTVGDN